MATMTFEKHDPQQIRVGLSYQELERFGALLGLSLQQVARLLLISERTLARRRHEGRLTQPESDRLVRLIRLSERAINAFDGHVESAVAWLTTSKALLGGETPLQHADTEPGRGAVEDMLAVIQYGTAA